MAIRSERPSPTTIVHLSDLHIRSELDKSNFYSSLNEAGLKARNIVSHINDYYPKAAVVVSGDLTDSGTLGSLELAASILKPIRDRGCLFVVPGNHDCETKGLGVLYRKKRKTAFHRVLDPKWSKGSNYPWFHDLGDVFLIGVDSISPEAMMAEGRISDWQLNRLRVLLRRAAQQKKLPVVVLHHDPWLNRVDMSLENAGEFSRILQEAEGDKRPIVLCGHGHQVRKTLQERAYQKKRSKVLYLASPSSSVVVDNALQYRVLTIGPRGGVHVHIQTVVYE